MWVEGDFRWVFIIAAFHITSEFLFKPSSPLAVLPFLFTLLLAPYGFQIEGCQVNPLFLECFLSENRPWLLYLRGNVSDSREWFESTLLKWERSKHKRNWIEGCYKIILMRWLIHWFDNECLYNYISLDNDVKMRDAYFLWCACPWFSAWINVVYLWLIRK